MEENIEYTFRDEDGDELEIGPNNSDGTPGEVYVGINFDEPNYHKRVSQSVALTPVESYKAILALAASAGFEVQTTPSGVHIKKPISEAVTKRTEELSLRFFDDKYEDIDQQSRNAIDFIIKGEIERGELS